MIIFYMFLLVLFLILLLFFKIKINIFLKIDGTKSYVKIKFLFWKIERKGSFFLRQKQFDFALKKDEKIFNKKNTKFKYLLQRNIPRRIISNNTSKKKKKFIMNLFVKKIDAFRFEFLEIYEEIGALEPVLTAYALPIISTLTVLPLNLFNIKCDKIKYNIVPLYTDLRFNLTIKTEITFRLINLLYK